MNETYEKEAKKAPKKAPDKNMKLANFWCKFESNHFLYKFTNTKYLIRLLNSHALIYLPIQPLNAFSA